MSIFITTKNQSSDTTSHSDYIKLNIVNVTGCVLWLIFCCNKYTYHRFIHTVCVISGKYCLVICSFVWMGSVNKGTNHQTILPKYYRQVKHETKFDPQFHSYGNWTWQHINSYLHRFKIRGTPSCPCGTQDQMTDHLLFECELLRKERNDLTTNIFKTDGWPISKSELIRKHLKAFFKFRNDISFDKITNSEN
jgi:hypothetical protein